MSNMMTQFMNTGNMNSQKDEQIRSNNDTSKNDDFNELLKLIKMQQKSIDDLSKEVKSQKYEIAGLKGKEGKKNGDQDNQIKQIIKEKEKEETNDRISGIIDM